MIPRMYLPDGRPRDYADPNAWFAAVAALTNGHIDAQALAEEGLDIRNVKAEALTNAIDAGSRTWATGWTTQTDIAADGLYANESTTPLVLGTSVELDWSAAVLGVAVNATLIIRAEVAYGYADKPAIDALPGEWSTVLLLDTGTGYSRLPGSRFRSRVLLAAVTQTDQRIRLVHRCYYAIQPKGAVTNVKKIGISVGNNEIVHVNRAQIMTYLLNRSQ